MGFGVRRPRPGRRRSMGQGPARHRRLEEPVLQAARPVRSTQDLGLDRHRISPDEVRDPGRARPGRPGIGVGSGPRASRHSRNSLRPAPRGSHTSSTALRSDRRDPQGGLAAGPRLCARDRRLIGLRFSPGGLRRARRGWGRRARGRRRRIGRRGFWRARWWQRIGHRSRVGVRDRSGHGRARSLAIVPLHAPLRSLVTSQPYPQVERPNRGRAPGLGHRATGLMNRRITPCLGWPICFERRVKTHHGWRDDGNEKRDRPDKPGAPGAPACDNGPVPVVPGPFYPGRLDLIREWIRYESVLNTVLAPFPVSLICIYDTSRLDPAIVANARRTHPVVSDGNGTERPSPDFRTPASCSARGTRSRRRLRHGPPGSVRPRVSRALACSCARKRSRRG